MLNSKVYTKKCVICGKEYKSISVRALTCGKQCRNELWKICGNDGRHTEDLAGRRIKYWRIVAYEVFKTD